MEIIVATKSVSNQQASSKILKHTSRHEGVGEVFKIKGNRLRVLD